MLLRYVGVGLYLHAVRMADGACQTWTCRLLLRRGAHGRSVTTCFRAQHRILDDGILNINAVARFSLPSARARRKGTKRESRASHMAISLPHRPCRRGRHAHSRATANRSRHHLVTLIFFRCVLLYAACRTQPGRHSINDSQTYCADVVHTAMTDRRQKADLPVEDIAAQSALWSPNRLRAFTIILFGPRAGVPLCQSLVCLADSSPGHQVHLPNRNQT